MQTRMKLHANARHSPQGRELLVDRVKGPAPRPGGAISHDKLLVVDGLYVIRVSRDLPGHSISRR